jgi:hypothetical protein
LLCVGFVFSTSLISNSFSFVVQNSLLNFAFIALQLLGIVLYFSIKQGRWVNITSSYLGWGDILFFLSITTLFPFVNYIAFYLLSLVVTLLLYPLLYVLSKNKMGIQIPLAGIQAGVLWLVLIYSLFDHRFLWNDYWVFNLMN